MSMLVQWDDERGNLYEAGLITRGPAFSIAYIKKWDKKGRKSATKGTHTILWQGSCPPARPGRLVETLMEFAEKHGCPYEKARKLR